MIVLAQSLFSMFMEVFCYKLFMEAFCPYKSSLHRKRSFLLVIILFVLTVFCAFLFNDSLLIRPALIALEFIIVCKIFFDAKILLTAILTIIYMALQLAADYLVLILYLEVFMKEPDGEILFQGLIVFLSKLIAFLMVLLIRRVADRPGNGNLTTAEWSRFLFFPLFSIAVYSVMMFVYDLPDIKKHSTLLWFTAFALPCLNLLMFSLMHDIVKRESKIRESKISEAAASRQLMLYESIVENLNTQSDRLHEYKNQIQCLQVLAGKENYTELEHYLEQISRGLSHETDAVDTHHAVVNAIINSKYRETAASRIITVFMLDDLSGLWLDEYDTVVLLANLLDNAIEACKKVDGRRVIKLKMTIERRCLVLSVRNTYDGVIKSREGVLLSTKEHAGQEHGIGVKNIIGIVEKYGGHYVIEPQSTEFIFSIMIPKADHKAPAMMQEQSA